MPDHGAKQYYPHSKYPAQHPQPVPPPVTKPYLPSIQNILAPSAPNLMPPYASAPQLHPREPAYTTDVYKPPALYPIPNVRATPDGGSTRGSPTSGIANTSTRYEQHNNDLQRVPNYHASQSKHPQQINQAPYYPYAAAYMRSSVNGVTGGDGQQHYSYIPHSHPHTSSPQHPTIGDRSVGYVQYGHNSTLQHPNRLAYYPSPSGRNSGMSDIRHEAEGKSRKRHNLPKHSTQVMRTWFEQNIKNPYPSEEQKAIFATATGISMTQVSNWFINHRRRCPELRDQRGRRDESDDDDDDDSSASPISSTPG